MKEPDRQELIKHRLDRAKETLREIDIYLDHNLFNTAINRLYYACYYAVTGLLLTKDIHAGTHAGVRHMLGLHFIKPGLISNETGKVYTDLFDKRLSSDYDDFTDISRDDIMDFLPRAKQFVEAVEELIENS